MIMSFNVPEKNPRFIPIIDWYKGSESQERSREFRKIMLSYLVGKPQDSPKEVSTVRAAGLGDIKRIQIAQAEEVDLDQILDSLGED